MGDNLNIPPEVMIGRVLGGVEMSKDLLLKGLVDDCLKRVPPKQTAYLEYLQKLASLSEEEPAKGPELACRLWLILLRPKTIPAVSNCNWSFKLDEHVLGILERLITRRLLGAHSAIDITKTEDNKEVKLLCTFAIVPETLKSISKEFDTKAASPSAQIKLIQLLLTAGSSDNQAAQGPLLGIILNKLAEVMLQSSEPVNQNAAKAAITQIINGRMDGPPGDDTSLDQGIAIFPI